MTIQRPNNRIRAIQFSDRYWAPNNRNQKGRPITLTYSIADVFPLPDSFFNQRCF
ncbi:MAG: hypothetical protein AAGM27_04325 [Cyanobacteria bacterium J06554_3]